MNDRQDQFEQLSAYLDGELDAGAARRLEEALAGDEELQRELASLRETRRLLKRLGPQPAPEHFARDVLRKAERHHHLGRALPGGVLRSARWIPMAVAAVVLLACGFAMFIIANLSAPEPMEDLALTDVPASAQPAIPVPAAAGEDRERPIADMARAVEEDIEPVVTEVIYTDDLELAHFQVREALLVNSLTPVLTEGLPSVKIQNRAANVYNLSNYEPDNIRVEVDVLADQAPQFRADLARIRSAQTVLQHGAPAPIATTSPAWDDLEAVIAEGPDAADRTPEIPIADVSVLEDDAPAAASPPPVDDSADEGGVSVDSWRRRQQLQRVIVIVNRVPPTMEAQAGASEPADHPAHLEEDPPPTESSPPTEP